MSPLAWIGAILIVVWLLGWLAFKIASGLIHLVLIVGIALLVWGLVKKGANAVRSP
jgi:hypothetical protein